MAWNVLYDEDSGDVITVHGPWRNKEEELFGCTFAWIDFYVNSPVNLCNGSPVLRTEKDGCFWFVCSECEQRGRKAHSISLALSSYLATHGAF